MITGDPVVTGYRLHTVVQEKYYGHGAVQCIHGLYNAWPYTVRSLQSTVN